ncbi:9751_t:CDS:10 [Paraglomus brasilianum]|uniref:Protein BFR2 n=1 Tax=Paraglomus brasilianum TaxID=144538 RepID=A0A9N9AFL8_9GLOM|nr:9751_t:CDS:10 [Paraglomus brasilianum]
MSSRNKKNTLFDQLEELLTPAPVDIDPETFGETFRTNANENEASDEDENKGREHYVNVGKSAIRKNLQLETDDSRYFGKNDEEATDDEEIDSDEVIEKDDNFRDADKSSYVDAAAIREELRKIEDDERNILKKISQSAKADITKGQHVKAQLANTRIRLQKALTITNTFPQHDVYPQFLNEETNNEIKETQTELRALMDMLVDLQKDIYKKNGIVEISKDTATSRKRQHEDDNYLDYLWGDMQELYDKFNPFRQETIDKWNNKVQIAAGLPLNKKFKAINQSVNTQIEQILNDKERLVKRTQLKRNDGKILGKEKQNEREDETIVKGDNLPNYDKEIFDDTDFYQQLLRELIDSRMVDTDDQSSLGLRWAALKQTKQKKKQVDTKASKGRRLRYHVHEKLQNFMVPIPAGSWHEEMIDELYSSLLGKKYNVALDEDEDKNGRIDEEQGKGKTYKGEGIVEGVSGLKIFG